MTEEEVDVVEDVVDNLELLDSGRARFTIDSVRYTLRLPRHGEFKRLRLQLTAEESDKPEDQIVHMENWVRDTFKLLGDKRLPEDADEWPQWIVSAALAGRLLVHWQNVPLALGAPSTR